MTADRVQRAVGVDIHETSEQFADSATEIIVETATAVGSFLGSPEGHVVLALGITGVGTYYGTQAISRQGMLPLAALALMTGVGTSAGNAIMTTGLSTIVSTAVSQVRSMGQPRS
jgi:hypothetical protein